MSSDSSLDRKDLHASTPDIDLDTLPALVFVEQAGRIVFANCAARTMLRLRQDEPLDKPVSEIFWGLYPGIAEPLGQGIASRPQETFECRLITADNQFVPVYGTYRIYEGREREALVVALPVPASVDAPRPGNQFLEEVLSSAPDAVVITHGTRILHVNPEFTRLFGFNAEEVAGQTLDRLIVPATRHYEPEMLRRRVDQDGRASIETVRQNKQGDLIDVALLIAPMVLNGSPVGYYSSYRDLRQRKQREQQQDVLYEAQTGLANRLLFHDRVQLAIARRSQQSHLNFAVLYLNLDNLEVLGARYGEAACTQIIKTIAARLKACFRPQDTVARMNTSEFAVLLDNVSSLTDLRSIAARISCDLGESVEWYGKRIQIRMSIGITYGADRNASVAEVVRDATYAMFRANKDEQAGPNSEILEACPVIPGLSPEEPTGEAHKAFEDETLDL